MNQVIKMALVIGTVVAAVAMVWGIEWRGEGNGEIKEAGYSQQDRAEMNSLVERVMGEGK